MVVKEMLVGSDVAEHFSIEQDYIRQADAQSDQYEKRKLMRLAKKEFYIGQRKMCSRFVEESSDEEEKNKWKLRYSEASAHMEEQDCLLRVQDLLEYAGSQGLVDSDPLMRYARQEISLARELGFMAVAYGSGLPMTDHEFLGLSHRAESEKMLADAEMEWDGLKKDELIFSANRSKLLAQREHSLLMVKWVKESKREEYKRRAESLGLLAKEQASLVEKSKSE